MPTVLSVKGYRFHFYASDRDEPIHVHVSKGSGYAKIWLEPDVEIQYFENFKAKEQRDIWNLVLQHKEELKSAWHEFFG